MGLLDASIEQPPSKLRRRLIMVAVFIVLGGGGLWYLLRYHTEKATVHHFLNAVVAGNMQQAYQIWKPAPSYSFQDFLQDWGPDGYYGPVKSFNLKDTDRLKGSNGVVIIVEVSPYQPFPDKDDAIKQSKTKEVRLWVEFKDQSISFPPD